MAKEQYVLNREAVDGRAARLGLHRANGKAAEQAMNYLVLFPRENTCLDPSCAVKEEERCRGRFGEWRHGFPISRFDRSIDLTGFYGFARVDQDRCVIVGHPWIE